MKERAVIHVELTPPPVGFPQHSYYGCVAAIYESLDKEVLGISKESLWNGLRKGIYKNRKCIVRVGTLKTKPTRRGFKPKSDE